MINLSEKRNDSFCEIEKKLVYEKEKIYFTKNKKFI
jgi:hypothetical protein